ncbi:hypothetical protein O181_075111 [Austropuccinia psidii MF-1]|uniref:Uncharacterized protein n=1 Tax=Austropuccinia psidii MF-1 TaxID=1389203 RepID=A0A9Q3F7W2_9BASI|nr:hypothetical protein [Austropuccinia psidii MF-1]
MLPKIHQGVMNSWNISKKFLKEEEIVRNSNGWNPLSSTPQIKNKLVPFQKEGGKKGRIPSSFYQKAQVRPPPQEEKKNKRKNWRKPYSQTYII